MFDKVVLGFLMDKDMTGYEIKKYMENSTSFFFNTSYGNIYPTLKKLQKEGLATSHENTKNGKLKKSYSITIKGKKVFQEWLKESSDISMIRDEALCRVFFFSHLKDESIKKELNSYIEKLQEQIDTLSTIKENYSNHIDEWKLTSLNFGIEYYVNVKNSYRDILKKMEK